MGTYENGSEAKRDCTSSYASIIGMILYLASNKRPYIFFYVHLCDRFTHNTNASHETDVKRIWWYLQGTKENGLVFNPSKKIVVDCYADANFVELWLHENPQDTICDRSRTRVLVTFENCLLLWVSKLQTNIDFSTLHSEYMVLYHSVRELRPLESIIKEVIKNWVIDSEKLKFVSRSTAYVNNNGAVVLSTSPRMTPR